MQQPGIIYIQYIQFLLSEPYKWKDAPTKICTVVCKKKLLSKIRKQETARTKRSETASNVICLKCWFFFINYQNTCSPSTNTHKGMRTVLTWQVYCNLMTKIDVLYKEINTTEYKRYSPNHAVTMLNTSRDFPQWALTMLSCTHTYVPGIHL